MEKYSIIIEVRNSEGKIITDSLGVKRTDITFEKETSKDITNFMEFWMSSLLAWMPQNQINLSASVFNSISDTWMTMYEFRYANGKTKYVELNK